MVVTLGQLRQPAIICDAVGYRYGGVTALQDVTFRLEGGELAFVVGPSASGKTTLLRLVHGQLRPASGRLIVQGTDVGRVRGGRRLRRQVGFVFQDYRLLDRLTALENVTYALRIGDLGLSRRDAGRRGSALLEEVGLGSRLDAYPRQLSGGQQQRVAIARALAPAPALLLADEPTANLDEENAAHVLRLLWRAARRGTAVLVATHDASQAAALAARVLLLERGRLRTSRTPPVLRAVT